jgi:CBS domain-containing protein
MIGIPVSRIMRKGLITVKKKDSIESVAKVMKRAKIGRVTVSERGKLVGVVTAKDIIRDVIAAKKSLKTPVSRIMKYPVRTVTPETDIEVAIKTMNRFRISSLPVTVRGRAIGMITERDLVKTEPALLDLVREKELIEKTVSSEKELMISGECGSCGNYSENLRLVTGQFLCEDCR